MYGFIRILSRREILDSKSARPGTVTGRLVLHRCRLSFNVAKTSPTRRSRPRRPFVGHGTSIVYLVTHKSYHDLEHGRKSLYSTTVLI
ncbi:hypothetical protein P152DRAFT_23615 [Eremomyces bilateralis CBS 781.70]|uniref:Uncharacterized protein n=1 Tax=Eremomyces bilateralis CBS 781.70 TaxID=1392243 RepID=A0A6G1GHN6_9PEZI|nr:uncharacterized protein P152DRAFT_23615 [Eremomyces bilateralis CBS 781.70]KAF1817588.1 hypothetical protein P152DRAFT_23615 [Eremomyces bilateralis CBS 781.70]